MASITDVGNWRLQTPGGIPIRILERNGSFEEENSQTSEVVLIRSSDLLAFVLESFPLPYAQQGTIVYPSRRRLPGLASLITKRVSYESFTPGRPVDPFGTDLGAPTGTYEDFLKVTIDYGTSAENDEDPDSNDPNSFLEITANGSGEFLNLPMSGKAKWEAAGGGNAEAARDINVPNTVTQPEVEWTIRWTQIPWNFFNNTLLARLRSKLGTVNNSAMSILAGSPKETVLLVGWSLSQQYTWRTGFIGASPIKMEFKFLEKNFVSAEGVQVTHNHFYRPGHGYRKLLIDGTNPVYKLTNLDQIFLP